MQDVNKKLSLARPKVFIPSLYFAEGLPFTIVNSMSVLLFKTLGADNDFIGFFTSLLYIPWTFKLFWAPMVDFFSTRRRWIISIQWILVCLSAALSFAIFAPHKIYVLLGVFALMAFMSATQDI
jgi:PAT family beta-lactamase induction signal transducer AmpG